tara:strand:- start:528 stop:2957 length:2430 start_codon:yes stop_codon:yes gene_type:complete
MKMQLLNLLQGGMNYLKRDEDRKLKIAADNEKTARRNKERQDYYKWTKERDIDYKILEADRIRADEEEKAFLEGMFINNGQLVDGNTIRKDAQESVRSLYITNQEQERGDFEQVLGAEDVTTLKNRIKNLTNSRVDAFENKPPEAQTRLATYFFGEASKIAQYSDERKSTLDAILRRYDKEGFETAPDNLKRFVSRFHTSLGAFAAQNRAQKIGGQEGTYEELPFPTTGVSYLDDYIMGVSNGAEYHQYKKNVDDWSDLESSVETRGYAVFMDENNNYRIAKRDSEEFRNRDEQIPYHNIPSFLLAGKHSKQFYKPGIVDKGVYEMAEYVDLYMSGQAKYSNRTSEITLNMLGADNIAGYQPQTGWDERDANWGNPIKERYGNPALFSATIDALQEKNWNQIGTRQTGAPTYGDKDVVDTMNRWRDNRTLFADMSGKASKMFGFFNSLLQQRELGIPIGNPGSIGTLVDSFLKNIWFSGNVDDPRYASSLDYFRSWFEEGANWGITTANIDPSDWTDGLTVRELWKGQQGSDNALERWNSLFPNLGFSGSMSEKEFEQGKKALERFRSNRDKYSASTALGVQERTEGLLIAMAYTFASFIQGGQGGTRTVSDADVLFALKALGASIGSDGIGLKDSKTLGTSIKIFGDRMDEIVVRSLPEIMTLEHPNSYPVNHRDRMTTAIEGIDSDNHHLLYLAAGGTDLMNSRIALDHTYRNIAVDDESRDTIISSQAQQLLSNENNYRENLTEYIEGIIGSLENNYDNAPKAVQQEYTEALAWIGQISQESVLIDNADAKAYLKDLEEKLQNARN